MKLIHRSEYSFPVTSDEYSISPISGHLYFGPINEEPAGFEACVFFAHPEIDGWDDFASNEFEVDIADDTIICARCHGSGFFFKGAIGDLVLPNNFQYRSFEIIVPASAVPEARTISRW